MKLFFQCSKVSIGLCVCLHFAMPLDIWIAKMWCVVFDPEHLLVIEFHHIFFLCGSVMLGCLDILENKKIQLLCVLLFLKGR